MTPPVFVRFRFRCSATVL